MTSSSIFNGPAPQTGVPNDSGQYVPVRHLPQVKHRVGFSNSGTNPFVDTSNFTVIQAGAGMSYSQSSSNLVLASGTTAKAEMILRSTFSVADAMNMKAGVIASQRIANCQLILEVVDVIGDGLAAVINSATSVTVTFVGSNPFTAANISQLVSLGAYSGTGSIVPGANNAVVTSVSALTTTFTVAGAAAGSGTLSVFGLNYTHVIYDGTTATTAKFGTQRNGWPFADASYAIYTTAGVGHDFTVNVQDDVASFEDALPSSSTGAQFLTRASLRRNMPDGQVALVMQIRLVNLGTAPASTTTFSLPYIDIENYAPTQVAIVASRPQSKSSPMPVEVVTSTTVPISGAISGTVTANPGAPYLGTPYGVITTAAALAVAIKASAASLMELTVFNATASTIYVKLYNKATTPLPASDIPLVTIPVTAGAFSSTIFGILGKRFSLGMGIGVTGAAATTDTTAPAAGAQISATYV